MGCAEMTRVSWAISNSSSMAAACCITSQSLDEPMIKPTMGEPRPLCVASVMLNSTILGHQPSSGLAILGRRFFQDIGWQAGRSEEHTSELQSLMRTSYAVYCLKKTTNSTPQAEDRNSCIN